MLFKVNLFPGPTTVMPNGGNREIIILAASICARIRQGSGIFTNRCNRENSERQRDNKGSRNSTRKDKTSYNIGIRTQ